MGNLWPTWSIADLFHPQRRQRLAGEVRLVERTHLKISTSALSLLTATTSSTSMAAETMRRIDLPPMKKQKVICTKDGAS